MKQIDVYPWLVLKHTKGLSAARALKLAAHAGGARQVLDLEQSDLLNLGVSPEAVASLREFDEASVERDLDWLERSTHHFVPHGSAHFPPMLAQIPDPPLGLYLVGEPNLLNHPQIAMVGSRKPTRQGEENAAAFAHYLAEAGFAITSGLALGIDAASHRGALALSGLTVAVCGTGLDDVYPKRHIKLATEIAERGALVSEFSTQTPPHKGNFPRRNRLISGLSVGVLVIEAAYRSGSLITARYAGEQGREIFALPGSIHNPMARGCHRLIRDGARLVESGEDILEELGQLTRSALDDNPPAKPSVTTADASGKTQGTDDYDRLLHSLGYEPSTIDQLCSRSGLTADAVSSMLLILGLHDEVLTTDGGRYMRAKKKENK
ncbi:MAG: DNA-processing protein DprA [Gammaproteobacteria bacterium]